MDRGFILTSSISYIPETLKQKQMLTLIYFNDSPIKTCAPFTHNRGEIRTKTALTTFDSFFHHYGNKPDLEFVHIYAQAACLVLERVDFFMVSCDVLEIFVFIITPEALCESIQTCLQFVIIK